MPRLRPLPPQWERDFSDIWAFGYFRERNQKAGSHQEVDSVFNPRSNNQKWTLSFTSASSRFLHCSITPSFPDNANLSLTSACLAWKLAFKWKHAFGGPKSPKSRANVSLQTRKGRRYLHPPPKLLPSPASFPPHHT